MQTIEMTFDKDVTESAVITMAAGENAFRLFPGELNDCALSVMMKPLGSDRWYRIMSAPKDEPGLKPGNLPLALLPGDEFRIEMEVVGDDDRALTTATFQLFQI